MFRKHFNATTVVATVALVFAMTGGAYAAKKYLITSTKQISPTVLKQLKGAKGSAGPAGPAGPVGAQGAQGQKGETGAQGAAGQEGPEGKEGKEGKAGATGKEGSPWTAGGTLPSKKTETGVWANPTSRSGTGFVALSFDIPLVKALEVEHIHLINNVGEEVYSGGERPPTECTGGSSEEPKADPGNLCVYESALAEKFSYLPFYYSVFPTDLITAGGVDVPFAAEEGVLVAGSWAVTAE